MQDIMYSDKDSIIIKSDEFKVENNKLLKHDFTSFYGSTNPQEFFAEAVKDVYAHGADARPISKEIMKVYEEMMLHKLLSQEGVYKK